MFSLCYFSKQKSPTGKIDRALAESSSARGGFLVVLVADFRAKRVYNIYAVYICSFEGFYTSISSPVAII